MALYRIKARWTGFTGSPGYSIFHFQIPVDPNPTDAQTHANDVRQFFFAMQAYYPTSVRIQVESTVEVINESDGKLEDMVTLATPLSPVQGADSGAYSSAVGACVTWDTTGIRAGRRVRGRTFVVPLGTTAYATDGTLSTTFQNAITAAAAALIDGQAALSVFARPSGPGATDGSAYGVTGARVADKTAVLRSRRD